MSNETSVPTPAEITKLSFNDSRSQKNQPPYFDPRKTVPFFVDSLLINLRNMRFISNYLNTKCLYMKYLRKVVNIDEAINAIL